MLSYYWTSPEKQSHSPAERERKEGERDCCISRFQVRRVLRQTLGGIQSGKCGHSQEDSLETVGISLNKLHTLKLKLAL